MFNVGHGANWPRPDHLFSAVIHELIRNPAASEVAWYGQVPDLRVTGPFPHRGEGTCWVNVSPIASEAWRLHDRSAPVALFVAVRKWVQERHAEEFSSLDAEARRLRLRELLRQSVLLHAPIVTYGYALTVHKAQGGDWDEVWVDCRYAGRPNSEEYFRWMYTATTRAKRKLVVVEAPRIDDLVEALSNGIERMEGEGVAEDNVPEHPVRNLGDVLGTGGYLLRRCVERDWVHRCFVVPQHELVANRLCVAAHGRLTILSVTSKGPFLLRMTLRTERGVAFVDCYFDGKGVVTKMGNATLPLEDLSMPRPGFCIMAPGQVSCESKGRVTAFRIGLLMDLSRMALRSFPPCTDGIW